MGSNCLPHRTFVFFCLFLLNSCGPTESSRSKADTYSREHRYEEAIAEYHRHINDRLGVKNRPEWENPYLYLLDIGDIYLEQGDVEKALENYKLAEDKEVKESYVIDRYRYIATWYEKKGDLKSALKHLEKYRDKDPLLFDLMLDRISRQMVKEEDSK